MSIATISEYGKYIDLQNYTGSEPANSGSIYLSGSGGSELVYFNRGLNAAGSVEAEASFVIGSADLDETDMEKLDGITNGTVAANKAVVADGNKDASGFRHVTATGAVTAGTSFVIGSADLNETDLEKLDGITDGTAAANKALVLDSSKDASGLRNVTMTGDMTAGTVTMTGFSVDADGDTALKSLKVDDGSTIGCDSDSDLMTLADGVLTVAGTLSCDTSFTLDSTTLDATEFGYLDGVTAGTAAASKALVLDSNKAIGTISHLTATYAKIDVLDVNEINSQTRTETTLEVVDKLILAASGSASAVASGGGLQVGGTSGSDTVASVLYDHGNTALDFNIGGTTEMRLQDGVLRPETDNDVDLGAAGAEFKDLYLDGVAYVDELQADQLGAALDCDSQAMTNINVDSGNIDGTVIGAAAVAAGSFAAVVGTTGTYSAGLSATTVSGSGAAQFATLHCDSVNLDGGAIDGTVIGANSEAAAAFTTVEASSTLTVEGAATMAAVTMDGILSCSAGVEFDSTLDVDGAVTLNGAVTLGNATSDTITATARFASDLVPSSDSARDLGTSALQWADIHADAGHIDAITVATIEPTAGSFSLDLDGTTTGNASISITDNLENAFEIKQGANSYMMFSSTDSDEYIAVSKTFELGDNGSGVDFKAFGGSADHFMLYDAAQNRLEFSQDGGSSNHITIGGDASGEYAVDVSDGSNAKNKIRAAAFVTYSDETLKTDVAPMQNALKAVNSINAVNFTWKKDGSRDFGFLAQDLKKVVPQAVHGNANGLLGVDYGRLTSVLVAAIQEQSVQINALRTKLENK